jgi:hypothetical protein
MKNKIKQLFGSKLLWQILGWLTIGAVWSLIGAAVLIAASLLLWVTWNHGVSPLFDFPQASFFQPLTAIVFVWSAVEIIRKPLTKKK